MSKNPIVNNRMELDMRSCSRFVVSCAVTTNCWIVTITHITDSRDCWRFLVYYVVGVNCWIFMFTYISAARGFLWAYMFLITAEFSEFCWEIAWDLKCHVLTGVNCWILISFYFCPWLHSTTNPIDLQMWAHATGVTGIVRKYCARMWGKECEKRSALEMLHSELKWSSERDVKVSLSRNKIQRSRNQVSKYPSSLLRMRWGKVWGKLG